MGWGSGNLGGGGASWAMVIVNYPSGSTLTATNVAGKKDISSTQRLYYIKKPTSGTTQTCTVTATNGTQTKSQTVSGITIGTSQTITLSYAVYLLKNGIPQVPFSNVDFRYNSAPIYGAISITQNTDNYYGILVGGAATWVSSSIEVSNSITNNGYTTLHADYIAEQASSASDVYSLLYAFSSRPAYAANCPCQAYKTFSSRYESTIDISSFGTNSFKIGICLARQNVSIAARIYNIWLT